MRRATPTGAAELPVKSLWPRAARVVWPLMAAATSAVAVAGPPFVSDDPEPTDRGHWEIYTFVAGTVAAGETVGQAGFDINYGGAQDLQLTAVVPLGYRHDTRTDVGLGGIELAAKYKFLHQSDGSPLPDLAFFPRLITPTAGRTFGTRRLSVFLPLWGQKDFGKWSLFGGGGYTINPGVGQRSFWLEGLGLSRSLSDPPGDRRRGLPPDGRRVRHAVVHRDQRRRALPAEPPLVGDRLGRSRRRACPAAGAGDLLPRPEGRLLAAARRRPRC